MLRTFGSSEPEIALRAYLYLIGAVAFRRSVTYGELAWQIKRGGPNPLAKPLELLTRWCKTNGLPALTSLVVQEATGLPAPGFTAVEHACKMGLEGIVSRQRDFAYRSGRCKSWLKIKNSGSPAV